MYVCMLSKYVKEFVHSVLYTTALEIHPQFHMHNHMLLHWCMHATGSQCRLSIICTERVYAIVPSLSPCSLRQTSEVHVQFCIR
jgi:hypothetical protein